MDKDDHIFAEFIFQAMKQKPKNLVSTVAQFTYDNHKNSSIKERLNFDPIFEYLAGLSLVTLENDTIGRGRPQVVELTSIGEMVESVDARLRELRYEQYNQRKRQEREDANRATEIEYFKRQNWLAKYWWMTSSISAIVGAIIGALVQKFIFC
ncbi:hypothetical protein [Algoriphagus marincola]|uniref:hypothetical protein n=1 Tax=Algoriphagus marincola TaxID=264027 RepID=UPI0004230568|nr:hypothetical protein [Algoriphagus marincola]